MPLASRREFIRWSTAAFLAVHARAAAASFSPDGARAPARAPRLRRLRMKTHVLPELRRFWGETIGFPVVAESASAVSFAAGETRLEFEAITDGSKPYHHFAFNIPENQLDAAKPWLAKRAEILKDARDGSDVIFFREWNAHSLFFYDPAGNLGELIARHTLENAADGPFDVRRILYASEIGLVPPNQPSVFEKIRRELAIEPYLGSKGFLGDEHGIVIVIPKDVKWIPRFEKTGMLCETHVTVAGHGDRRVTFSDLPFEIVGEAS